MPTDTKDHKDHLQKSIYYPFAKDHSCLQIQNDGTGCEFFALDWAENEYECTIVQCGLII